MRCLLYFRSWYDLYSLLSILTVLIIERVNIIKIVSAIISSTVIDIEGWSIEWEFSCTLKLLEYDLMMKLVYIGFIFINWHAYCGM